MKTGVMAAENSALPSCNLEYIKLENSYSKL